MKMLRFAFKLNHKEYNSQPTWCH